MTCNMNEQQQDAKNNAELQTKLTKTTWKIFEDTVRRGRNGYIKVYLVTEDDDDYEYFKTYIMGNKGKGKDKVHPRTGHEGPRGGADV